MDGISIMPRRTAHDIRAEARHQHENPRHFQTSPTRVKTHHLLPLSEMPQKSNMTEVKRKNIIQDENVGYSPHTLQEYRRMQQKLQQSSKSGGLGANITDHVLKEQEKRKQRMSYGYGVVKHFMKSPQHHTLNAHPCTPNPILNVPQMYEKSLARAKASRQQKYSDDLQARQRKGNYKHVPPKILNPLPQINDGQRQDQSVDCDEQSKIADDIAFLQKKQKSDLLRIDKMRSDLMDNANEYDDLIQQMMRELDDEDREKEGEFVEKPQILGDKSNVDKTVECEQDENQVGEPATKSSSFYMFRAAETLSKNSEDQKFEASPIRPVELCSLVKSAVACASDRAIAQHMESDMPYPEEFLFCK